MCLHRKCFINWVASPAQYHIESCVFSPLHMPGHHDHEYLLLSNLMYSNLTLSQDPFKPHATFKALMEMQQGLLLYPCTISWCLSSTRLRQMWCVISTSLSSLETFSHLRWIEDAWLQTELRAGAHSMWDFFKMLPSTPPDKWWKSHQNRKFSWLKPGVSAWAGSLWEATLLCRVSARQELTTILDFDSMATNIRWLAQKNPLHPGGVVTALRAVLRAGDSWGQLCCRCPQLCVGGRGWECWLN